jgi:hypothetical protein
MYRFYNNIIIKSRKMEPVLIMLTVTYFFAQIVLLFVPGCAEMNT